MEHQQAGAPEGAAQIGSPQVLRPQVTGSQPSQPRASGFAAFGTSGGAVLVFRDLASL